MQHRCQLVGLTGLVIMSATLTPHTTRPDPIHLATGVTIHSFACSIPQLDHGKPFELPNYFPVFGGSGQQHKLQQEEIDTTLHPPHGSIFNLISC